MWQAPNRLNRISKQISQGYNDGNVQIYEIVDTAEVGRAPAPALGDKICDLRYAEQRVGVTRYYNALQAQVRIDKVLRVQRNDAITTDMIAVVRGIPYRIDQVQTVMDIYPPSLDLSLVKWGGADVV